MGCDGHYEKAIYFLRPNGFTIMKIRRLSRYRRTQCSTRGASAVSMYDVRYWHLADIPDRRSMSALGEEMWEKADRAIDQQTGRRAR